MTLEQFFQKILIEKSHIYYVPESEYATFARSIKYIIIGEEKYNFSSPNTYRTIDFDSNVTDKSYKLLEYDFILIDENSKSYKKYKADDLLLLIIDDSTKLLSYNNKRIYCSNELKLAINNIVSTWKTVNI